MKPRLLIVEDDPVLRPLVGDYFEREDWDVVIAEDGEETLELFKEQAFGLVLLDIMLDCKIITVHKTGYRMEVLYEKEISKKK